VARVRWERDGRETTLGVRIESTGNVRLTEPGARDAGWGGHCRAFAQEYFRVTLSSDDGAVEGSFSALPRTFQPDNATYARFWTFDDDVPLRGNLALDVDAERQPRGPHVSVSLTRFASDLPNRLEIEIRVSYGIAGPDGRRTPLRLHATPLDGCNGAQLPVNGHCVDLTEHPELGTPPTPPKPVRDAGVDATPTADPAPSVDATPDAGTPLDPDASAGPDASG
jgi:hypothetical protein